MAHSRREQLGTASIVVAGITTAVAIAAWFVFIRVGEPDWGAFAAVFEGAIVAGNAVLFSIGWLTPRLREIRTAGTSFLLAVLPIALSFVVFSVTSAGVSSTDFDDDIPPIGAIALLCFLALAAALVGMLVFLMVVLPVVWLLRAIRPTGSHEGGVYLGMSRGELVGAALVLPAVIALAVAMVNMVPSLSGGTPAQRRGEPLLAFLTIQGDPIATVVAWLAIAVIVAALIGYRRAQKARLAKDAA